MSKSVFSAKHFNDEAAAYAFVEAHLWPNGRVARIDRLDAKPGQKFVNNWIKIGQDDTVTVIIPHCDMGTGIYTSLPQMAAALMATTTSPKPAFGSSNCSIRA